MSRSQASNLSKELTHFSQDQHRRARILIWRAGWSVPTRKELMSKEKGPPGYPGDEAIKKKFGELMRELRLEKGLSIEQVDGLIDEGMQEDTTPLLPRALALVTRELRERKKMSRAQLSEVSGLPLRLINRLERAKVHNLTLTQVVRIAMALGHDVGDFVEQVFKVEERLKAK